jgi:protein-S-isoprenylcysteine O-methyltransferase Ste14
MNHDVVLALVSAVWVALELVVGLITRSTAGKSTRQDRGSYTLMWILLIVAAFVGGMIHQLPVARMPFPNATFWFGIALILGGMAIRATAIATLRRFFTTQVTIQESHELIDRGLYSVIRHPSYTGALIAFVGLGFAFGSWLSLAIIVAAALVGFGYRIRVEEAALTAHFGERYRSYSSRTKRLIPWLFSLS